MSAYGNCGRLSRSDIRPCSAAYTHDASLNRSSAAVATPGGLAGLDRAHQDLERPPSRRVYPSGCQAGHQRLLEHNPVVPWMVQAEVTVGTAACQQLLARVADPGRRGCLRGGQVGERLLCRGLREVLGVGKMCD